MPSCSQVPAPSRVVPSPAPHQARVRSCQPVSKPDRSSAMPVKRAAGQEQQPRFFRRAPPPRLRLLPDAPRPRRPPSGRPAGDRDSRRAKPARRGGSGRRAAAPMRPAGRTFLREWRLVTAGQRDVAISDDLIGAAAVAVAAQPAQPRSHQLEAADVERPQPQRQRGQALMPTSRHDGARLRPSPWLRGPASPAENRDRSTAERAPLPPRSDLPGRRRCYAATPPRAG